MDHEDDNAAHTIKKMLQYEWESAVYSKMAQIDVVGQVVVAANEQQHPDPADRRPTREPRGY